MAGLEGETTGMIYLTDFGNGKEGLGKAVAKTRCAVSEGQ